MPPSVRMSQPLKVAAFQVIISGRFWVIAKVEPDFDLHWHLNRPWIRLRYGPK